MLEFNTNDFKQAGELIGSDAGMVEIDTLLLSVDSRTQNDCMSSCGYVNAKVTDKLTQYDIDCLFTTLGQNPLITGLKFLNVNIDVMAKDQLKTSLEKNDTIKKIEFNCMDIKPELVIALGNALETNTTVKCVCFMNVDLEDVSVEALALAMIKRHGDLTVNHAVHNVPATHSYFWYATEYKTHWQPLSQKSHDMLKLAYETCKVFTDPVKSLEEVKNPTQQCTIF